MATIKKDIGAYSAYAIAVKHGYKGTEAEWVAAQEKARVDSEAAAKAAQAAQEAAEAAREQAQTAKTGAETAQTAAAQAAQTATGAESAATQAAQAAQTAKEAAEQAKTGAQKARTGAETAKTEAQAAQTAAEKAAQEARAAQTGAVEAKTGAVEAQRKAEEAAQGVAADREQIGANKSGLEAAQQELTATKQELTETKAALTTTKKDLAKAQRAIQFQATLNKGQTWDFETDTQEAYQRQVPSGAKAGAVMEYGGKTVGWNQCVALKEGSIVSNAGPEHMTIITHGDVTSGTIVQPVSYNGFILKNLLPEAYDLVSNHMYLMLADLNYTTAATQVTVSFQHNGVADTTEKKLMVTQTWQKQAFIAKMTTTVRLFSLYIDLSAGLSSGDTVELRNQLLVDLTLLYGPGNEPTDTTDPRIAQIEAYAAAHPEYNAGELVSALVDEVNVIGANILRPSGTFPVSSNGITAVRNQDSTITINGTSTGYPFFEVGRLQLKKGTTYFIPSATRIMQLEDGNRIVLHDNNNNGFTPDKDYPDVFLEYTIAPSETFSNAVIKPIVSVGALRDYSPYTLTTLPIPDAVKQLPGYGWSAGSVANTIERTENGWQYVQRVGSVDLGSLSWSINKNVTYGSKYFASNSIVNPTKAPAFLTAGYTAMDSANVLTTDMSCWITFNWGENGRVIIRDDKYTDVASFKTAMSGKPLYYELATPITTDITALMGDALAPFAVEAGGSITLHHPKADEGFALDVPAKIQYITKLSEVSANG